MPGLPIEIEPEPEVVAEILNETLNEVSPVTEDTIPDLEIEETTRTGILEGLDHYGGEDDKEEPLNEVEPPDEDEIEDDEPPDKEIDGIFGDQKIDSDQESDDEVDETDTVITGTIIQVDSSETDTDQIETQLEKLITDIDNANSDAEQKATESDSQNGSDVEIKRDSSEEFQDAADKLEGEESSDSKESKEKQDESREETNLDEQTNETNKDTTSDHTEIKDRGGHDDHEGTPVDPVESPVHKDNTEACEKDINKTESDNDESQIRVTDIDHNSNIESQSVEGENAENLKIASEESCEQDAVELRSDVTVTGLRTSTAETV